MSLTFSTRLSLEIMESRALPSTASVWAAIDGNGPTSFLSSHHDEIASDHHHHGHDHVSASTALSGWLAGQVTTTLTSDHVDGGSIYALSGKAKLAGLGEVTLDGSVQSTGFVAHGHAAGQLTLTKMGDPNSTLTVKLTGPRQPGLANLPETWTAHVTGGTGSFANIHGHTTLTMNVAMSDTITGHGTFHGSV